jgi:dipeptidase
MCDTMIAMSGTTAGGVALFAKNSDRHPNEGQQLVHVPRMKHEKGENLQCTYIRIPQVKQTHALLLSKPYWIWGAEIGVNEHGLAIGNEAVFTRVPANKTPALLGMDLLRLALERAVTPREAVEVITVLLEQHGQGGNCTVHGEEYYNNSFLVADHEEAWVLETVGKRWAARQVKDVRSISNCLSIQEEWDLASVGEARSGRKLNFTREYSDLVYTNFGRGPRRRAATAGILKQQTGHVTVATMLEALRYHENGSTPGNSLTEVDVCMHAGYGPIRIGQSTASMVVYLGASRPVIFATGTSAPCTGVFKPLWVDTSLPALAPTPADTYDPDSLFWAHERLHREVRRNFPDRLEAYAPDRDTLESEFVREALSMGRASMKQRAKFAADCFRQASHAEGSWLERVREIPARKSIGGVLNDRAWEGFNREAKMPL